MFVSIQSRDYDSYAADFVFVQGIDFQRRVSIFCTDGLGFPDQDRNSAGVGRVIECSELPYFNVELIMHSGHSFQKKSQRSVVQFGFQAKLHQIDPVTGWD